MSPFCLPLGAALVAACFSPSGQTTAGTGGPATTTETTTQGAPTTSTSATATTSGPGTASGTTGPGTTTTDATSSTGNVSSTDPGTTAGTTGSTGSGTTDAPDLGCGDDNDCKLHSDCCTCAGVPVDEQIATCDEDCKQTRCDEYGVDQAICRFGVCTTERLSCDQSKVACNAPAPACPEGQLPAVADLCWSGQCVPAALCDVVPDCSQCPPETVCVQDVGQGPVGWPRCEPIPAVCGGVVSCDCVGPFVCPDEFPVCAPGNGLVECQCLNC